MIPFSQKCLSQQLRFRFSTSFLDKETIYALSSGVNTAISVVRISGPNAYKALQLLQPHNQTQEMNREQYLQKFKLKPKVMSLRSIYGQDKGLIDKGLVVYFGSQTSYSGEDLFEFHLHGSKAVVNALFQQLSRMNFSMAKQGQFTRRALLNKRVNLQQAQAIGDLIESQMQFERQVAVGNMLGKNKIFLEQIRRDLIQTVTLIEAYIEFEQEDVGSGILIKAKTKIGSLLIKLQRVLQASKQLQNAREGVKISIVGRPNVGKSTLINALTKRQMAIVSPIPGTTRDLIEGELQIEGFRVKVVDTAGIRASECMIEQEGIRRTGISISESQLLVVLVDISATNYAQREDYIVIRPHSDELDLLNSPHIISVINKVDKLPSSIREKQIRLQVTPGQIIRPDVRVSLKEPQGVEAVVSELGQYIKNKFDLCSKSSHQVFFTRARYIEGLQRCCLLLEECDSQEYADLISVKLSNAMKEVEELVGRVDSEDILDSIFSTFCIGK